MFQSATLNDQRVFHIIPQKLVPWLGPEKWTISPVRQSWRIWPAWHLWSFWIFPEMPSFGTPRRGSKLNMMSESVTHDGWRPYPIYWVLICWERNSTSKTHISISSSNCQNLCCCTRVQWLTSAHLLGMWPWQQKTIARYYWTILVCCWVYTYVWNLSIYIQMVLKHLAKEVCKSDPWTFRRKQTLIIRLRSFVEVGYMEIVPILQGLYSICSKEV